jgi:hypothetical protein
MREVQRAKLRPAAWAVIALLSVLAAFGGSAALCIEGLRRADRAAEIRQGSGRIEAARVALDALGRMGLHGYAETLPDGSWHVVIREIEVRR